MHVWGEEFVLVAYDDLRGVPLLIVDDDAMSRCILDGMVRQWRMQACPAGSGEAGLAKLDTARQAGHPYRLALIAEQMPGMDGFEVATRILANPAWQDTVPVMLLCPGDSAAGAARCRKIGVEHHLSKPVKRADLLAILHRLLASPLADTTKSSVQLQPGRDRGPASGADGINGDIVPVPVLE